MYPQSINTVEALHSWAAALSYPVSYSHTLLTRLSFKMKTVSFNPSFFVPSFLYLPTHHHPILNLLQCLMPATLSPCGAYSLTEKPFPDPLDHPPPITQRESVCWFTYHLSHNGWYVSVTPHKTGSPSEFSFLFFSFPVNYWKRCVEVSNYNSRCVYFSLQFHLFFALYSTTNAVPGPWQGYKQKWRRKGWWKKR